MHSQVNNYFNMYDMDGSVIGLTEPFFVGGDVTEESGTVRTAPYSCVSIFPTHNPIVKINNYPFTFSSQDTNF